MLFLCITLDLILSLYLKAALSSFYSLLLELSYLPCASSAFPALLPLFTYPNYLLSILNSIFLSHHVTIS